MLLSLHVKNLAIIDEVEVYFKDRLNILTGETGAGKSILIGSINIALGAKVSKEMIRKGADYALVELVFHLDDQTSIDAILDYDIPLEDGQVIISRKIMNGKSICKINGENVTAAMLKEISGYLLDIHGQHEHQSLLYKKQHLNILDRYAKDEIGRRKEEIAVLYRQYQEISSALNDTEIDEEKRNREISFLEYEINEIESARLLTGEDEQLADKYKRLANSNMILDSLSNAYQLTAEADGTSINDLLARASRSIYKAAEYDARVNEFSTQLSEIEDLINGFNRDVADYIEETNIDQEEFAQIEGRLDLINNLKAKYGNSLEKIQEYCSLSKDKLDKYQDYETYTAKIKKEKESLEKKLEFQCKELSSIRQKKASELTTLIRKALVDLNFNDVRFEMEFKQMNHFSANGYDDAEFMISTNPGEDIKPLAKVTSGGELSRIMLAIKSVLADSDAIDTLIFDEIDVGVSGRTAQKVSEKLSLIAKNHQVLCITHLPQIAAMADAHYVIEKETDGTSTQTNIMPLSEEGEITELARMLGGAKITSTVIESAREMKMLAGHSKAK